MKKYSFNKIMGTLFSISGVILLIIGSYVELDQDILIKTLIMGSLGATLGLICFQDCNISLIKEKLKIK